MHAPSTSAETTSTSGHQAVPRPHALAATALGALGIVYGDIGTSPLYAMKECLAYGYSPHAVAPDRIAVLGVLSLIFWALMLVVCLKYLVFVLRADNKGEGGILALAALIGGGSRARVGLSVSTLLALFGAGLLFGDGVITPAISVLGAMEGLSEQSPSLSHLVVPITVAILVALFVVQRHGTGRIGGVFGWIMLAWFIAIGVAGARGVAHDPSVLEAVNPHHAVDFFRAHGIHGFLLLGSVILAVTGAEALYADMGHFGRTPIRVAWFTVALPGILLNYFGQGAYLLHRTPGTVSNPFYGLVEGPALIPMLILATMAAVIASQALISGVFSLTRQAMQLGFWPRMTVVHTSAHAEGQIYIPEMNWLLMAACVLLVLEFRTSSALAAAYGIAVAATMVITSILFFMVAVRRWGWSRAQALPHLLLFLSIDLAFVVACSAKFLAGGWFPILVGVGVFTVMTTWWRGRLELSRLMESAALPSELFLADLAANPLPRVEGTAVFMSSTHDAIPNVLLHHVKHNRVLHQQVVLFSMVTEPVPWVSSARAVDVTPLGHGVWRVIARVGFMQSADVPALLQSCASRGLVTVPITTTYYLGRQTLLTTGHSAMAKWRKYLFALLVRNAKAPTTYFHLPPNRVVELGLQVEI
ncbi:MAG TPA: KUP/HAK/KT family potassium transporter [Kofleriaceae bacterium]|jgi:KUP system potassium uptake protein|nr:KUP/HAK/KT family potassium transporter [Kofleriaceae bacterium]